jgi:hypothetical protein
VVTRHEDRGGGGGEFTGIYLTVKLGQTRQQFDGQIQCGSLESLDVTVRACVQHIADDQRLVLE